VNGSYHILARALTNIVHSCFAHSGHWSSRGILRCRARTLDRCHPSPVLCPSLYTSSPTRVLNYRLQFPASSATLFPRATASSEASLPKDGFHIPVKITESTSSGERRETNVRKRVGVNLRSASAGPARVLRRGWMSVRSREEPEVRKTYRGYREHSRTVCRLRSHARRRCRVKCRLLSSVHNLELERTKDSSSPRDQVRNLHEEKYRICVDR
jgi:hypothetical protein